MADKILVVEDIEIELKYLKKFLEDNFYEVIGVKDGKEALESFKKEKPEIVILDISMGEYSANWFLEELKKTNKRISFLIILSRYFGKPEPAVVPTLRLAREIANYVPESIPKSDNIPKDYSEVEKGYAPIIKEIKKYEIQKQEKDIIRRIKTELSVLPGEEKPEQETEPIELVVYIDKPQSELDELSKEKEKSLLLDPMVSKKVVFKKGDTKVEPTCFMELGSPKNDLVRIRQLSILLYLSWYFKTYPQLKDHGISRKEIADNLGKIRDEYWSNDYKKISFWDGDIGPDIYFIRHNGLKCLQNTFGMNPFDLIKKRTHYFKGKLIIKPMSEYHAISKDILTG